MKPLGAICTPDQGVEFTVWAPYAEQVEVRLVAPAERTLPLHPDGSGYWRLQTAAVGPGADYLLRLDGRTDRPDPASRFQPGDVHGPSRVVDHAAFAWSDADWSPPALEELVIYELHVGTYTREGTFAALIPHLDALRDLGVTAIELMPVAQFPGRRNWGYDGVHPFAVQNSYGGPDGLKALVDACHARGLAVVLDVVYNHLGPEGNYLRDFGPYFTDRYRTPWGEAVNFDGPGSDAVRHYFIANALAWFRDYHIDALRLDAVHAIFDFSARPFLQQLAAAVADFNRTEQRSCRLIAESDLNDARLIRPQERGGFGLDGQWSDDFHHALHVLLTGEERGYYADFGTLEDLAAAYRSGFVYSGRYSRFRERHHGNSAADRPGRQFVVCSQNHDQVGNRPAGERLISLAGFEAAKLAAAAVLLAPAVPLLFMGEEYGERAPFLYFVDFADPELQEAVRQGRKSEFPDFDWPEDLPDPQDPEAFRRSRLDHQLRHQPGHQHIHAFYRELLRLRRELPALAVLDRDCLTVDISPAGRLLRLQRWQADCRVCALFNFDRAAVQATLPDQGGPWQKLLDSADARWAGPGSDLPDRPKQVDRLDMAPLSAALFLHPPKTAEA